MTNTLSACTSILIGKKASIDGSIMIGRNEDAKAAWPKHMVVHQRGELGKRFISKETKLELVLPGEPPPPSGLTGRVSLKKTESTNTTWQ